MLKNPRYARPGAWTQDTSGRASLKSDPVTAHVLMYVFRAWVLELPVSWFNFYVLMNRIYEPRVGELRAHRIGMSTRIAYIFGYAYGLLYFAGRYSTVDLIYAGLFWMGLWLAFEWFGSGLMRRPIREVLVGWHVNRGYMWPYVLAAYLLSPLIVGELLRPGS